MRMATCAHCGEEAPVNYSDGKKALLIDKGEYCAECWEELGLGESKPRLSGQRKRPAPAELIKAGIRDNITRAREEDR